MKKLIIILGLLLATGVCYGVLTEYPLQVYHDDGSFGFRVFHRIGRGVEFMGFTDMSKPEKAGDGIYVYDIGDIVIKSYDYTMRIQAVYLVPHDSYLIWFRQDVSKLYASGFYVNDMAGREFLIGDGTKAYYWVLNPTADKRAETRQLGDFLYLRMDVGTLYYVAQLDYSFSYILKDAVEKFDSMLVKQGIKKN